MDIISSFFGNIFTVVSTMFGAVGDIWFILFPPLLWWLFFQIWTLRVEEQYHHTLKWVLLELIPPRDLEKSPQPMESVFWGFAGVMNTLTVEEVYVQGKFPVSFSLEIAGTEGNIRFFVRTQKGFRNLVESHFYAQYPNMEIVEAEDYTREIPQTIPNKDWDLWGSDFKFVRDDAYPIKTYKFFEESVTGTMLDPLAGCIETMAKLGPGEHIWYQLIITPVIESWADKEGAATVEEFLGKKKEAHGIFSRLLADLGDVFANLFNGLMGHEVTFAGHEEEAGDDAPVEFRLTPGEKKVLEAMQSNLGKQQFDTKMRFIYLARKESFKKPMVSAFVGAIKNFNDFNMNSVMPDSTFKTYAQYLFTEERLRYRQRRIFRRYVDRDPSPHGSGIKLSTEELATMYHIPDMSVATPTLPRVMAKRGGAPSNLPVQDMF